MVLATLLAAVLLAAVQQLPRVLPLESGRGRHIGLSMGGGFSIAFVFLGLLPELRQFSEALAGRVPVPEQGQGQEVYLLALAGLVAFYGLERFARRSRRDPDTHEEGGPAVAVITVFAAYYATIGYLLWYEPGAPSDLAIYTVAMAIHFLAIDVAFRSHHRRAYAGAGRWVLSAAVLVGAGLGFVAELPEAVIAALLAFLAGGIILIALQEELPHDASSRWWPFALGALSYAVLLLFL